MNVANDGVIDSVESPPPTIRVQKHSNSGGIWQHGTTCCTHLYLRQNLSEYPRARTSSRLSSQRRLHSLRVTA
jgi:hypothetical protein